MNTAYMIHQLRLELWNLTYTQWKTQTLFSIQWWSIMMSPLSRQRFSVS